MNKMDVLDKAKKIKYLYFSNFLFVKNIKHWLKIKLSNFSGCKSDSLWNRTKGQK